MPFNDMKMDFRKELRWSLCCLGWPGMLCVDQAVLELAANPPAFALSTRITDARHHNQSEKLSETPSR